MRNINFALTWYATTICTLLFSILFLVHLSFARPVITPVGQSYQSYRALPNNLTTLTTQEVSIGKTDARTLIIYHFFKENNAPLSQAAEKFIEVADKYSLDFRLLPAIAMQESNGGRIMPNNSFNPFGYGIYGGKVLRFASFEEAIERVGQGLKEDYIDRGLKTPDQIMAKYTPPSIEKGGPWAISVSSFMAELH